MAGSAAGGSARRACNASADLLELPGGTAHGRGASGTDRRQVPTGLGPKKLDLNCEIYHSLNEGIEIFKP